MFFVFVYVGVPRPYPPEFRLSHPPEGFRAPPFYGTAVRGFFPVTTLNCERDVIDCVCIYYGLLYVLV